MITSDILKKIAIEAGAEKCGIASIESFINAPEGFKPTDIYKKCKSILVFIKSIPSEIIMAENPVPYTNAANMLYAEIDRIGLAVCRSLEKHNVHSVPVPCDDPYLYWDAENKRGQGILSMRHSAYLAGLGILGKNTLLMNEELGNMVYIGALLLDASFEPDRIVDDFSCPVNCNICINSCPQNALDGVTVNQKLCREVSFIKTERGFDIYNCSKCRQVCPQRTGYRRKSQA